MKIAVIILHFGDIKTTKKCVASLQRHERKNANIIVVNNMPNILNSSDFSKKKIAVINNQKNIGFAAGVNVGIHYALKKKYDAILLLNNDTIISKPILNSLSLQLKNTTNGIVGPTIRFKKNGNTLYDIGGKINTLFFRTSHNEVSKIKDKQVKNAAYVSGCCMLIKKDVCKKIGYFDERFFLYYEDADFCLRAKKAGFSVVLDPSVVIDHELSKSAGKMSVVAIHFLLQSGIRFGQKYAKNFLQKITNKLFILYQAIAFLRANKNAWVAIVKVLLSS